jgi:hypothetical protein
VAIDPKKLSDPKKLRILQENAERLGHHDIAKECKKRIFELAGIDIEDPIEARLWQAVTAYEEILREKHGRNQKAGYTRRKIKNQGALVTLTDWALNPKVTPGFEALVNNGLAEYTGEYVVLEYCENFSNEAVAAAKEKLAAFGVHVS